MKRTFLFWLMLFLLSPLAVNAVPTLQVGAPAGTGDTGIYADYTVSLTDPTETDTAVTFCNTLLVAGLYANNDVVNLGGQSSGGLDWINLGFESEFAGKGAILLATVPEVQFDAGGTLTVDGISSFYSSLDDSHFPNNHAPVGDPASAYFFFDIGDFSESVAIPDFADETTGGKDGEIKSLELAIAGFDWVHFDVMALQTTEKNTTITTTAENNPGSHDVTWKDPNGGGGGGNPVTEPATLLLLGIGLAGTAGLTRRKKAQQ